MVDAHYNNCESSFFRNIDRVFAEDYVPTIEDMIHVVPRNDINTGFTNITSRLVRYRIIDNMIQTSRRQMQHFCRNAACVVYVVRLDDYDRANDDGLVGFPHNAILCILSVSVISLTFLSC